MIRKSTNPYDRFGLICSGKRKGKIGGREEEEKLGKGEEEKLGEGKRKYNRGKRSGREIKEREERRITGREKKVK